MADSIDLIRINNNQVTHTQRRKIMLSLASPKLSALYKRTIVHWLAAKEVVTSGSNIAKALIAANRIVSIWH